MAGAKRHKRQRGWPKASGPSETVCASDAQVSRVTLWVETFREATRSWWMDCRSDWFQTLKRDSAMPLNRENRRSAVPGFLAALVGIETLMEKKGAGTARLDDCCPARAGRAPHRPRTWILRTE